MYCTHQQGVITLRCIYHRRIQTPGSIHQGGVNQNWFTQQLPSVKYNRELRLTGVFTIKKSHLVRIVITGHWGVPPFILSLFLPISIYPSSIPSSIPPSILPSSVLYPLSILPLSLHLFLLLYSLSSSLPSIIPI